jgi:hypothetical protein
MKAGTEPPRRHRIVTTSAPGMTAANPFKGEAGPGQSTVNEDGLSSVLGAAWRKSAAAQRTK